MVASARVRSKALTSTSSSVATPPAAIIVPKTTINKITKKPSASKTSSSRSLKAKKPAPINSKKPQSAITTVHDSTEPEQSALSRCLAGGPNGPKVYDELGFELSYKKCAAIMKGGGRRPRGSKYYDMLKEESRENARKGEIMGTPQENVSALTSMAWNDRVSRELGIPYHKVEMKHFEELARRGFVGRPGEFEAVNISKEENERIMKLCTGSAFRA